MIEFCTVTLRDSVTESVSSIPQAAETWSTMTRSERPMSKPLAVPASRSLAPLPAAALADEPALGGLGVEVARANAKVANHDVRRLGNFDRISPKRDAARRGLAGDRQLVLANFQSVVQLDRAADVEHDRSRPGGRANRMPQAAFDFRLRLCRGL